MQYVAATNRTEDQSARQVLVAAVALIVTATILGIWSAGENVHAFDVRVSIWVQQWQGSLPRFLQRVGDMSGDTLGAVVSLILLLAAVAMMRGHQQEIHFVLIVAAFRIICMFLKNIFNSPRPTADLVDTLRQYDNTGYPSGHSTTAAMIGTGLVILVFRHTDSLMLRSLVIAVSVGFVLLVGWSRIWAGAHWPTDVLGGWCYGVGCTLLASWIAFRSETKPATSTAESGI